LDEDEESRRVGTDADRGMVKQRHEPGPPMTLVNMYEQGVCHLIALCHNDAFRHQAIFDVSSYPPETLVPWFKSRVKCGKCGGTRVDVRPKFEGNGREHSIVRRARCLEKVAACPVGALITDPNTSGSSQRQISERLCLGLHRCLQSSQPVTPNSGSQK
jgi:hypothetical protein